MSLDVWWLVNGLVLAGILVVVAYRVLSPLWRHGDATDGNELVTIATFRFPGKAEAAKWFLEQEGIWAFLSNANLVSTDWFLGNAVGNVRLDVPRRQLPDAQRIFEAHPRLLDQQIHEAADEPQSRCLSCDAEMPEEARQCERCGWTYEAEPVSEN